MSDASRYSFRAMRLAFWALDLGPVPQMGSLAAVAALVYLLALWGPLAAAAAVMIALIGIPLWCACFPKAPRVPPELLSGKNQ